MNGPSQTRTPVNILAFDTCFGACSVAVAQGSDIRAEIFAPMLSGHAEHLMPMIEETMAKAGLSFTDLDRIAVTTGPGTFTGTRTGIAAARALALATACGTVGLSSLAVMAAAVRSTDAPLAIVVDARRGEIYHQLFDTAGAPITGPAIMTIETAAHSGPAGAIVFAGSGAAAVAEIARSRGRAASAIEPGLLPRATHMPALAIAAAPSPVPLRPIYMRPPDAKPQTANILTRVGQ